MSAYDRLLVEQLLPTVWDRAYAYGMANPTAPDPDMPKATAQKNQGGTLLAHLADMQSAWRRASLSQPEKRALLFRFGLGWTNREAAAHEGVSATTIQNRVDDGIGQMVRFLKEGKVTTALVAAVAA